ADDRNTNRRGSRYGEHQEATELSADRSASMTDKDELAALRRELAEERAERKREVEELKAKVSPPEKKPFVPEPWEPIDWTARMTMPPSALEEMVRAEPRGFMAGVVHDNRAPTGRPGMIPNSQQASDARPVAGDGKGFAREMSLGPSAREIELIDRGVNAALP